jgi:hypothetical protein
MTHEKCPSLVRFESLRRNEERKEGMNEEREE